MKKQHSIQKLFLVIGLCLGIIVTSLGILFMATPPDTYSTKSPDDASFGADFYTYEYEATVIAAKNAAVTANNLREMGEKAALYVGTTYILIGVFIILHYSKRYYELWCHLNSHLSQNVYHSNCMEESSLVMEDSNEPTPHL